MSAWHLTPDTWHLTYDMWHVTQGGGWTFSQNFSSLLWFGIDSALKIFPQTMTELMNELINYSVTKVIVKQPRIHRVCKKKDKTRCVVLHFSLKKKNTCTQPLVPHWEVLVPYWEELVPNWEAVVRNWEVPSESKLKSFYQCRAFTDRPGTFQTVLNSRVPGNFETVRIFFRQF